MCGINDCSNMLHHVCQNNIDHNKFDEGIEETIDLEFLYLDCMSTCMMSENKTRKIFKPSNKLLDIIEIEDEEKSQDKNLEGLFDSSDSSNSDSNDDDDSSDNYSSGNDIDNNDKLDVVEFDIKGHEINDNSNFELNIESMNDNTTSKSNESNKNKAVSKLNEKLNELPKHSSSNQHCEASLITNDTNDANQVTLLDENENTFNWSYFVVT